MIAAGPRLARGIVRDPITHFVVLGGLLFGLHALVAGDDRPVIEIRAETIEALVRERALLAGRPWTEQDRREVTETLIAEEVLLREAYRRSYDKTPRFRAQLVQVMRLSLAETPADPDEATLRAYFVARRDRFDRPATVDLMQVHVPEGDPAPDLLLARLNAMPGEPRHAVPLRGATQEDIARLFDFDAARVIATVDDRAWRGPFRAPGGQVLIRIDARHPAETVTYERVARAVADDWALTRRQGAIADGIARLRRDYKVIVPRAGSDG